MIFKKNYTVLYDKQIVDLKNIDYQKNISDEEKAELENYIKTNNINISLPNGNTFYIKENGIIVGFITYTLTPDEINIDRLYVFPEFREKKYGIKLVTLVLMERTKEHEKIIIRAQPDPDTIPKEKLITFYSKFIYKNERKNIIKITW